MAVNEHLVNERVERFKEACAKAKAKLTPQRLAIFREIARSNDHPNAELIHQRVRKHLPKISLDTVYRTLATLEDHGLACRVNCSMPSARYDHAQHPHHHLVCRCCGAMQDFTWETCGLDSLPKQVRDWGTPMSANLVVEGLCAACADDKACQMDGVGIDNKS